MSAFFTKICKKGTYLSSLGLFSVEIIDFYHNLAHGFGLSGNTATLVDVRREEEVELLRFAIQEDILLGRRSLLELEVLDILLRVVLVLGFKDGGVARHGQTLGTGDDPLQVDGPMVLFPLCVLGGAMATKRKGTELE